MTSLKDEIATRHKNKAKFGDNEVIYILYTVVKAWREWRHFCDTFGHVNQQFTALSSENVLLNMEGDIKIVTPLSSPVQKPLACYYGIACVM